MNLSKLGDSEDRESPVPTVHVGAASRIRLEMTGQQQLRVKQPLVSREEKYLTTCTHEGKEDVETMPYKL